jgi:hypothetical protein
MATQIEPAKERPLGYEQVTGLSAAKGLTTPAGARYARISCTVQAVRWRDDGTAPNATTGMRLPVDKEMIYAGPLESLQFIEESASAVLNVSFYG